MPRVRLAVALAAILCFVAVPSLPVPGASADAPPLHLGELSYGLPGPVWRQVVPGPDARTVLLQKDVAVRSEYISVQLQFAPPLLTRADVTAKQLDAEQKAQDAHYSTSGYHVGERTIGGTTYGTLSYHGVPSDGSVEPVLDAVSLVWMPPEFESRRVYYTVRWRDVHAAFAGPAGLGELDALVKSFALPPPFAPLLRDDFQDSGTSLFRAEESDHFSVNFADGELAIQKTDPDWAAGWATAASGGTFANVVATVDVRRASDDPGQLGYLGCRYTYSPDVGASGYRAAIDFRDARFQIQRQDRGQLVRLTPWLSAASIAQAGGPVHVELDCEGQSIAMSVNGEPGVSVSDPTYMIGGVALGSGAFSDVHGLTDVRFSNFAVLQG